MLAIPLAMFAKILVIILAITLHITSYHVSHHVSDHVNHNVSNHISYHVSHHVSYHISHHVSHSYSPPPPPQHIYPVTGLVTLLSEEVKTMATYSSCMPRTSPWDIRNKTLSAKGPFLISAGLLKVRK